MRIIDISVRLRQDVPTYPGDPSFSKTAEKSRAAGDLCDVSLLVMGSHAGTHVDAPAHYVAGGADLDAVPLASFVGICEVVDARGRRFVDGAFVREKVAADAERVLFKTDNGQLWSRRSFESDYCYLDADAAGILAARRLKLVGIDYLSVEGYGAAGAPAHNALLGAGVIILEGLDLNVVAPGRYYLIALPLAIEGGDGSPVRAVLLEGWNA